jgi:hypothetical protein
VAVAFLAAAAAGIVSVIITSTFALHEIGREDGQTVISGGVPPFDNEVPAFPMAKTRQSLVEGLVVRLKHDRAPQQRKTAIGQQCRCHKRDRATGVPTASKCVPNMKLERLVQQCIIAPSAR